MFRHRGFLLAHTRHTMNFYHPRCIDPAGGFYHCFRDDGTVYDCEVRHLVSSARFVVNYAMAWMAFGEIEYREALQHGIDYLRLTHRDGSTGGYAWLIRDGRPADPTNHCYGLAFVLLAYARALEAGLPDARDWIDETFLLMEERFWEERHGLYADEATPDWRVAPYRGQNANMHVCEALLAAHRATGESRFLDRAALLADHIVNRQAAMTDGMVWEHYHSDWTVDWDYNRGDRTNKYRPWGFQSGHQTEWAKLLLVLERVRPADWHLRRARELFDRAVALCWDEEHGGMVYGYDREGRFYDDDKYYWVQAESFAAAAMLGERTGEPGYWEWYDRLWTYSWEHFVDHCHGAWFRVLRRDNVKRSGAKSPLGKTDHHSMGACLEVVELLERRPSQPAHRDD